jgi:hypothetical protein
MVNHKRIYRLYREDLKRPRRHVSAAGPSIEAGAEPRRPAHALAIASLPLAALSPVLARSHLSGVARLSRLGERSSVRA